MISKQKIALSSLSILLLSAGCSLFSQTTPAGLIKTVNGGADWQFENKLKDSKNGSLVGLNISSLAYDPRAKDHIFAGSYNVGLYESDDAASGWTQILSKISVYGFALDPQDSKTIYAAGLFDAHGKVLVSRDGGKSWEEIFNDASSDSAVRAIAVNPFNSKEVIIGLNAGSVIKSIDGGTSWRLLSNFNDRVSQIVWNNTGVYALLRNKGLYKSSDGGENFVDNTGSLKSSQNFIQSALSGPDNTFYQFVASFTNPQLFYLTAGNGLYKSLDSGLNWQKMPVPLVDSSVPLRALTLFPGNDQVLYASAGATIYKSLDGGNQWKTQSIPTQGFINALLVDPSLEQIAYGGIYVQQ